MYLVINVYQPQLLREVETVEAAEDLAVQFAADNPGQNYDVYEFVSRSFGEQPVKVAASVTTKDVAAINADRIAAATAEAVIK